MRQLLLALLLLAPLTTTAEESSTGPLFMKDLVDEGTFFAPWGIGVDWFTMEQDYSIKTLKFDLPGVGDIDPSLVDVSNEVQHGDLKLDAWVTPFLNVFGLVGRLNNKTQVDLSNVTIPGLPFPLGTLPVNSKGPLRWILILSGLLFNNFIRSCFRLSITSGRSSYKPSIFENSCWISAILMAVIAEP